MYHDVQCRGAVLVLRIGTHVLPRFTFFSQYARNNQQAATNLVSDHRGLLYLPQSRPILVLQSGSGNARAKEEVRTALQGVSEWFDDYLGEEQGDGLEQVL